MKDYEVVEACEVAGVQQEVGDIVSLDAEAEETKSLVESGKIKAKESGE